MKCNKCGADKPLSEFYKRPWRKNGYDTVCKECTRKKSEYVRTPVKKKNNWLWTNAAIDCYKRNCVCAGCFFENFFTDDTQKCHMKNTVIELVKKYGIPKEEEDYE